MKKYMIVVLAVALFVTTAAFAPLAKKFNVLIHNNTEEDVKIDMQGPEDYLFTVSPGWLTKSVEEGDYDVSYVNCHNQTIEFSLSVTEDTVFEIPICPPQPDVVKYVIYSHIGDPLSVSLTNQDVDFGENYELAVEFGKNKYLQLDSGFYFYSYDACGTTFSGETHIKKNGSGSLTIKDCTRALYIDAGIRPDPTKMLIQSHYAGTIDVTLLGPSVQYLSIPTGNTRVDLIAGTYTYIYAYAGQRVEGTVVVDPSGRTVLHLPFFFTTSLP